MEKLIALLLLLFTTPCFAMTIKANTPVWLPLVLVSGDATGQAASEVTWEHTGLIVSYCAVGTQGSKMSQKVMTNTSWLNVGRGVYFVSFEAADVGTALGEFIYFVSVDRVTAPYWGARQVLTSSMDSAVNVATITDGAIAAADFATGAITSNVVDDSVFLEMATSQGIKNLVGTVSTDTASLRTSVDSLGVRVDWQYLQNPTATIDLANTSIASSDSVFKVYSIDSAVKVDRVFNVNTANVSSITDGTILAADFGTGAITSNVVDDSVFLEMANSQGVLNLVSSVSPDTASLRTSVDSLGVRADWRYLQNPTATVDLSNTSIFSTDSAFKVYSIDSAVKVDRVFHVTSADATQLLLTPVVTDTSSITTQITTMSSDVIHAIKTYR